MDFNAVRNKTMSSATFSLANESFTLGTDPKDSVRRELYFQNPAKSKLTDDEIRVLTKLGIDNTMQQVLRPFLTKFFEELPHCTTDASLLLSKSCEVPYYVIWSTEFANHEQTVERINALKGKTQNQVSMAQNVALVDELKQVPEVVDKYGKLFSLVKGGPRTPVQVELPKPTAPPFSVVPSETKETEGPKTTTNTVAEKYTRVFSLIPIAV
jgi:hypothetical protein